MRSRLAFLREHFSMVRNRRRWCGWVVASLGGILGVVVPGVVGLQRSHAQEVTGLQAAIVLEQAMTDAIDAAATRNRSWEHRARGQTRDKMSLHSNNFRPDGRGLVDAFGQRQVPEKPDATSPDFVPNEFGTGVVIDRSGLILTNYHLLDANSDHYVTTIDRKVFRTEIKAADPRSDLAVLQIKDRVGPTDFVPMPLGNAKNLKKGHIVLSLGNPYAIARDGQVSCSWGIVSNLSRKVGTPSEDHSTVLPDQVIHELGTLIQTDAKLNLGTSGGALVNLKGEMVGLTTALSAITGYDQAAGYAIPVDETFRRIIDTLKQGREVEYGFLGIQPRNLSSNDILNGKHGAVVASEVHAGTPANNAGLRMYDIITHVGDDPIYSADGLRLMVGRLPPARPLRLTFEREGRVMTASTSLSKYAWHGKRPKIVTVFPADWRGLQVDYVTAALGMYRADYPSTPCVAIIEVKPDSQAAKAGLTAGMLITHVDITPVSTPEEFRG